jgi:hypothetical protein
MFVIGWLRFRLSPVLWFPVNIAPLTITCAEAQDQQRASGPASIHDGSVIWLSSRCHGSHVEPAEGCDHRRIGVVELYGTTGWGAAGI